MLERQYHNAPPPLSARMTQSSRSSQLSPVSIQTPSTAADRPRRTSKHRAAKRYALLLCMILLILNHCGLSQSKQPQQARTIEDRIASSPQPQEGDFLDLSAFYVYSLN